MHSPTPANDFSFRLPPAFAPFQPLLSCCARCLTSKSRVLTLLRTLFLSLLSLRSFRRSPRLFSIICGLFAQNTGGGGTSATSPRSRRLPFCRSVIVCFFCRPFIFIHLQIPAHRASICNVLCFHALTNPFFRNFFVFTSIQNARVSPPPHNFLCRSDEDLHPDRAQRRGMFSTRHSSFTPSQAEGHSPLSPTRVIVLASKGDLPNVSERSDDPTRIGVPTERSDEGCHSTQTDPRRGNTCQ
jgi:hypothetical protein